MNSIGKEWFTFDGKSSVGCAPFAIGSVVPKGNSLRGPQ
jgi:hypothetical protein